MKQKRAYKYRAYPTTEQASILARTFGCARYVYNWALRLRTDAYYQRHKRVYYADTSSALTQLKQQQSHQWLNEVSSVPPQQALRHLDKAFRNFFEGRAKYPAFKKKQGAQTAEYTTSAFKWNGKHLTLARMDMPLDIHWSRALPDGCKPTKVTVHKDTANRYFVSLLVEEDITHLPPVEQEVGLDLGLKSMVILSTGETVGNPKFFAQDEKQLAKAQRRHARKQKGSKNKDHARRTVARIHARISDRRRDYQHKLSTRIIRENQTICVESLAVKNMVKNHCLAKAISDVGWGEFVRQLEYKSQWYGRTLSKIDRWYPSSKTCHECKHVVEDLPLDVREWVCPECGVWHDRDSNASLDILAEGLSASACGGGVRHARAKAREGNPQRSRKAHS